MKHTVTSVIVVTLFGSSATSMAAGCGADEPDRAEALDASSLVAPPSSDGDAAVSDAGANRSYADGTYTATGWYGNLPSSITVTVTLVNSIVVSVTVTPNATDPTSLDLQRRFAEAVPAVVVGRRVDEVQVGRLAGSSGTPTGFNDAIRKIREQASTDAGRH